MLHSPGRSGLSPFSSRCPWVTNSLPKVLGHCPLSHLSVDPMMLGGLSSSKAGEPVCSTATGVAALVGADFLRQPSLEARVPMEGAGRIHQGAVSAHPAMFAWISTRAARLCKAAVATVLDCPTRAPRLALSVFQSVGVHVFARRGRGLAAISPPCSLTLVIGHLQKAGACGDTGDPSWRSCIWDTREASRHSDSLAPTRAHTGNGSPSLGKVPGCELPLSANDHLQYENLLSSIG